MNSHDTTSLDDLVREINKSPYDLVRRISAVIKVQLHMVYALINECLVVVERIVQPDDDLDIMLLEVVEAILERRW